MSWPASAALRLKVLRSSSSSARASPEKAAAKPDRAATPSLISSATKWPSSSMSARATPGTAETASYASATISQEKLAAQKNVGRRRSTVATPSGETVHDDTNSSSVIGSSSSGSRTVPSAAQTASRRTRSGCAVTPAPRRPCRRR